MNQSQHHIQESWLKQFQSNKGKANGKVEAVSKNTLASKLLRPKEIACELNFQSAANEKQDNDLIESRAIAVLHRLKKGTTKLYHAEAAIVQEWVALHCARSLKSREDLANSPVSYDRARPKFLDDDLSYVRSFGQVWVYRADRTDEPLILSDNPILLMSGKAILCPFSPWTLIALSNHDLQRVTIEGRSFSEVSNEMSFSNATKELYGNPDTKPPWEQIKRAAQNMQIEQRVSQVRVK